MHAIMLFDFCDFRREQATDVTQPAGKTHYRRLGREHSYSTIVPNSQSHAFFICLYVCQRPSTSTSTVRV